jgi:hypothetical protein
VDTTTVAHQRTLDTRELRAIALAGEHFEEIALSHRGGRYTVPSLHGEHTATTSPTPATLRAAAAAIGSSATPAIT